MVALSFAPFELHGFEASILLGLFDVALQVIQLAAREIERRKISLDGFRGPFIQRPSATWHSWYVLYDRSKFPGDHFSIEVDDQTGTTRFWGGE